MIVVVVVVERRCTCLFDLDGECMRTRSWISVISFEEFLLGRVTIRLREMACRRSLHHEAIFDNSLRFFLLLLWKKKTNKTISNFHPDLA